MIFSQPPLQVKHTTADSPEELLDGGRQSRQVAEHFEAQGFVIVIRQGFPLGDVYKRQCRMSSGMR